MQRVIRIMGFGLIISIATTIDANDKNFVVCSSENSSSLKLNGFLKLDQRIFINNKELRNGSYIKAAYLNISGEPFPDLSFNLGLDFDAIESKVKVSDAYITYSGYKGLGDQFNISIGKINPSFSLENHSDFNCGSFLETSIATTPFIPDPGLGVGINKWQKDYSLNLTLSQPKSIEDEEGKSKGLQLNIRGTKAYFFDEHKLLQIGLYGNFKDDRHKGIEFSTSPEAKSRSATDQLLNTTINDKMIKAKNHYSIGLEALFQNGPFSAQAEGILTRINRVKSQSSKNLNFKGYYVKVSYILTGEFKEFESDQGILGRIISNKEGGIWEIASRYSFLNLNNKDILGGSGKVMGISLTWYYNNHVNITGEYLKNYIKRNDSLEKLNFDSAGLRLKLSF